MRIQADRHGYRGKTTSFIPSAVVLLLAVPSLGRAYPGPSNVEGQVNAT